MIKTGMKEVIRQYHAATGKMHDREQISSRYRQLRALWGFIKQLKTDTGLGRNSDGTVIADDDWWESKTKVHAHIFYVLTTLSMMFSSHTTKCCRVRMNGRN